MRNGLSDKELNDKGFYNCDLEDFLCNGLESV